MIIAFGYEGARFPGVLNSHNTSTLNMQAENYNVKNCSMDKYSDNQLKVKFYDDIILKMINITIKIAAELVLASIFDILSYPNVPMNICVGERSFWN